MLQRQKRRTAFACRRGVVNAAYGAWRCDINVRYIRLYFPGGRCASLLDQKVFLAFFAAQVFFNEDRLAGERIQPGVIHDA
jgi:hypothetical protein